MDIPTSLSRAEPTTNPPRPQARGVGIRAHLALLALLALLPAWGTAGFIAWRFAEAERAQLVLTGLDAARDMATAVEREVVALRASLAVLATSPALLSEQAAPFARQADLFANAQGVSVHLESAPVPDPLAREEPVPAVSGLERNPETGRLVITFRQPVERGPGREPARLVLSTDALTLWSSILQRTRLPPGWVASVLDRNHIILARTPMPERFVGRPVHPDALAALEAAGGAVSGWQVGSTRDGRPVHIAWREITGLPWTVLVGVPRDAVDGALCRAMMPVVLTGLPLLLGLTLGIAVWGRWRLARPLRALAEAASAVGRGGVPAVLPTSGVREIDAAGAALVAAAEDRRDREAESTALAAKLEAVLESTTDSVLVLDQDWRIIYLNSRARTVLGRGRELSGRCLWECLPSGARSTFEEAFRRALDSGMPVSAMAELGPHGPWLAADAFPAMEGLTVFLRDVTSARRAERALREGEARLKAVLDHVPLGVLLAEAPSGRITLSNRRLAEMLGVPEVRAEHIGGHGGILVFDADGHEVPPEARPLARAVAGETLVNEEYRYRRADGSEVWIRVRAAPIRAPNGRVTGAVAALMEIDAERQAAEALRESELRFRTLAEAVPQIVWSSGPDGVVDYVNPRFFEFVGQPPRDRPAGLRLPIHADDLDAVRRAWNAALDQGAPYQAEFRLRRADGMWRWFVARALPARGPEGDIRRWIGSATDVTELIETREALQRQVAAEAAARQAAVAAAEALAASEIRFRRFAEASPDVLWILDATRDRLDYASPAFEHIWGEAPDTGVGLAAFAGGLAPEDRARVEAALKRMLEGTVTDLEYRILRPDGQQRWVRVLGFPIRDTAERPALLGGFVRDITSRKEAEERQQLLVGELNHRVKNTLATVLSLARQTARHGSAASSAAPPVKAFLDDFQARLMALARGHDLLTASTWRGAMLSEVAAAALAPWRGGGESARAARIALSGPAVWLAPKQALGLALAIHEMATNAAKHGALGAPQGQVELAWRREPEGWVELLWTETGGPPAQPPQREGFGTRLLRSGLPSELGQGSSVGLDYTPAGFRAKIRFRPAPEGEAA